MGWLFGLFGLLCLLCVKDHRSYIRVRIPGPFLDYSFAMNALFLTIDPQGWIIPFVIGLVIGIVFLILALTGTLYVEY